MGSEVFHTLKKELKDAGHNTNVGDEGGFAPNLPSATAALDFAVKAIEKAGYKPGEDIAWRSIAPRPSSSGTANMSTRARARRGVRDQQVTYLAGLVSKFPIISIEDGMAEDDWEGWQALTEQVGDRCQLVGDDLFVTNTRRLADGIKRGVANAILVKVNQIGSLSETLDAVEMAHRARYGAVDVPPLGRDRGRDDCRPRRRHQLRADQDGIPGPLRPDGEIQPAHADRGRARDAGRLCRAVHLALGASALEPAGRAAGSHSTRCGCGRAGPVSRDASTSVGASISQYKKECGSGNLWRTAEFLVVKRRPGD